MECNVQSKTLAEPERKSAHMDAESVILKVAVYAAAVVMILIPLILIGYILFPAKKGEQKVVVQRFGNKLSELTRSEWLKLAKFEVSKMQNELLQDERFKVFEHDGIHIPQQHVGNKIQDEDLKARIESKNKLIQEYNNAADQLIDAAKQAEEIEPNVYPTWINFLKKVRQEVVRMRERGNDAWLKGVKWALGRILDRTSQLVRAIENNLKNGEYEQMTGIPLNKRIKNAEERQKNDVPHKLPTRRKRSDLER